jgi:segregation and condensation protein A
MAAEELLLPLSPDGPEPAVRSDTFTVRTDVFDGPLDLLLYLVKRDGIALERVEVGRIADAYLAWIEKLRQLDLSVAADFLFMAATLVHLKSLQLLPRAPTVVEEDETDPRDALIAQLVEYEAVKRMADGLDARPQAGFDVHLRPGRPEAPGPAPLARGNAFALLDLYHELLLRGGPPEVSFDADGSGPDFGSCCRRVVRLLGQAGGRADLGALLAPLASMSLRVVTFVGVLEMTRLSWLDVHQEHHLGPVTVEQRVEEAAIDWSVLIGSGPEGQLALPLDPSSPPGADEE